MKELTVENLIRAVLEFIHIWISQILYYRNIYRTELFSKVISFDILAYRSRHPKLNEYLTGLIQSFFKIQLQNPTSGQVGTLYIALYSTKSNRIREKYILKFNDLISLGLTHLPPSLFTETEDEVTIDETPINVEEINWDDIFTQLKTLLFKHIEELKRICLSQVELPDLFFKVLIEANETQSLQGIDNDWVQISVSSKLEDATDQFQSKVVLIGDASMGILNFDVHNEYSVE